jgi:hypothetical protein
MTLPESGEFHTADFFDELPGYPDQDESFAGESVAHEGG